MRTSGFFQVRCTLSYLCASMRTSIGPVTARLICEVPEPVDFCDRHDFCASAAAAAGVCPTARALSSLSSSLSAASVKLAEASALCAFGSLQE